MRRPELRRAAAAGWAVLALGCAVWSLLLLSAGVVVGLAVLDPGLRSSLAAAAGRGSSWAGSVVAALPVSEPGGQLSLDTAIGGVSLVLGAVLLLRRPRTRVTRWMGLGAVAAAGGFALQSAAGAVAVRALSGRTGGEIAVRALPAIAAVALLVAVLGPLPGRAAARVPGAAVGVALVGAAVLGASPLPLSWRCVLLLGLAVPVTGAVALGLLLGAGGGTEQLRVQARRLLAVLLATAAVGGALAVVTVVLWATGWTGLALVDPTVRPPAVQQTALLFWYGRLAAVGLAGAVLAAQWRADRATVESWFARGLAVALVATVTGGIYVLLGTLVAPAYGPVPAAVLATAVAAGLLLPGYILAERAADRLLYGTRPAPYSVLAGLIAFSPSTTREVPDLAALVESVGQGLGATTCRLTVRRPGLRDRSYTWTRSGHAPAEALQEFPVRHGGEQVGTFAVDREAVAGLPGQRRELLEAAAGSLGVVVQAVRSGIDLERQLRAALAHADDIASARRRLVAETDSERRRIERDLHDGAQHHLVSLRLALGLAEHQVGTGQLDAARAQLDRLAAQLRDAEAVLTRTAMGVASPVLHERGLVAALHAELDTGSPQVQVDTDAVPAGVRLGEDVEAAVYFVCLEAVGNSRKHAPGATVRVRIALSGTRLEFTVQDDGPGYEAAAGAGSPGRGLRNLTARIASLGGRLEMRSEPGRGTAVRGWVVVPHAAAATAQARPPAAPVPAPAVEPPGGPPALSSPLLDEVRSALEEAVGLYDGTPEGTTLRRVAVRLGRPLRIAVVPAPGTRLTQEEATAVAGELHLEPGRAVVVTPPGGRPDPAADAHLLLWHAGDGAADGRGDGRTARLRPTQAIGVVLTDPRRLEEGASLPVPRQVRGTCQVVVPFASAPDAVPAPGWAATRLRELVEHRFLGRAAELRARAAVEALEALLHERPPPEDGAPLLYRIDRLRSSTPELAELALLDALHGGALTLPVDEQESVGRLLGDEGADAGARLGCPPGADPEDLARAAHEQLVRWQRALWHPASTAGTRAVAEVLVRTCDRLAVPVGDRR